MENNEIIKALECCGDTEDGCLHCPLLGTSAPECGMRLCRESLDLINRYEAENKSLYKINAKADEKISELRKELLKRQNLEESFSKTTKYFDKKLAKTVKLERAEAIKEFVEKLKEDLKSNNYIVSFDRIDNLVKEMVG